MPLFIVQRPSTLLGVVLGQPYPQGFSLLRGPAPTKKRKTLGWPWAIHEINWERVKILDKENQRDRGHQNENRGNHSHQTPTSNVKLVKWRWGYKLSANFNHLAVTWLNKHEITWQRRTHFAEEDCEIRRLKASVVLVFRPCDESCYHLIKLMFVGCKYYFWSDSDKLNLYSVWRLAPLFFSLISL